MRQLVLSPRWIMWHLLTLGAMVACGWLSAWQWHRAGSAMGSALNVGYGLQWPLFAVFFGVMWWRMLRMEAARLAESDDGTDRADGDDGTDRADGPDRAAGRPGAGPPHRAPAVAGAATDSRGPAGRREVGPSPFGPRPESARPAVIDEDDGELAEYNRMLAQLAARNPED